MRKYASAEAVDRIVRQARETNDAKAAIEKIENLKRYAATTVPGRYSPDSGIDVLFRTVPESCLDCPFFEPEIDGCALESNGIPGRYGLSSAEAPPEWCPARVEGE